MTGCVQLYWQCMPVEELLVPLGVHARDLTSFVRGPRASEGKPFKEMMSEFQTTRWRDNHVANLAVLFGLGKRALKAVRHPIQGNWTGWHPDLSVTANLHISLWSSVSQL